MIKHTEVMKQALEALEIERNVPRLGPVPTKTSKAITALREALTSVPDWASEAKEQPAPVAEPRKQEPVALKVDRGELCYKSQDDDQSFGMWCPVTPNSDLPFSEGTKFYTSPPAQRTWVGLTDEETGHWAADFLDGAKWAEAKLKEKNGITKEQT